MFEWMPVLMGLCLGGVSVPAPTTRTLRLTLCLGVVLIALGAVFFSGEWRVSRMYLAVDLMEVGGGFLAGMAGGFAIRRTAARRSKETLASQ